MSLNGDMGAAGAHSLRLRAGCATAALNITLTSCSLRLVSHRSSCAGLWGSRVRPESLIPDFQASKPLCTAGTQACQRWWMPSGRGTAWCRS